MFYKSSPIPSFLERARCDCQQIIETQSKVDEIIFMQQKHFIMMMKRWSSSPSKELATIELLSTSKQDNQFNSVRRVEINVITRVRQETCLARQDFWTTYIVQRLYFYRVADR